MFRKDRGIISKEEENFQFVSLSIEAIEVLLEFESEIFDALASSTDEEFSRKLKELKNKMKK